MQAQYSYEAQAWKRHAELGYLALSTGLDVRLPGNIKRDEWDHWHTLVLTDVMARVVSELLFVATQHCPGTDKHQGYNGAMWGLGAGNGSEIPIPQYRSLSEKLISAP